MAQYVIRCYKDADTFCRNYEQCLLISKDMGDLSDVTKLAHTACNLYQQHGSPESGVTALDKAAKILEATQPRQALELFKRAVDITIVRNLLVLRHVTFNCSQNM